MSYSKSVDNVTKLRFIKNLPFFSNLSTEDIQKIVNLTYLDVIEKNQVFIEDGAQGEKVYFIIDGLARVYKITEEGKEITITFRSPGDIVGEMALLDDQPRSANVQAVRKTEVLVLSKKSLQEILLKYPSISLQIIQTLSKRIRENLQSMEISTQDLIKRTYETLSTLSVRFLDKDITLSQEELSNIVGATRPRVTEALNQLQKEGDQTEGTTSGYSGYKGTKLIKRTIDEIVPADSFFSDAIPKQADSLDFRYFDGYIVKGFGRVNVAKIDINQFTNNLLSKTPREQEDYVAKCCNFFHDVELALKELYAHRDKKYDIFLGSRTADSTIFYFKNDQDRESIEEKIRLAQGKHGVDIKTVGKVVTGVTLHSWADDAGHDEWSRRIFHSTKPVSELDWRDLEIAAVAANKEDPQQSPQYKIFFSE